MRPELVAATLSALALSSPAARAAESPRDMETDHLDAYDDGGPRRVALLANPAGVLLGVYGVELDLALGDAAALSAEADWMDLGGAVGYGLTLGLPVFPRRVAFHGFYAQPRVSVARVRAADVVTAVAGAGATLGWEWSLRCGLSLRLGAGAMVERAVSGDGSAPVVGVVPVVDGMVGWLF